MTKDEVLKMCLEYIETDAHERKYVRHAIKEALAQPEQVAKRILELEAVLERQTALLERQTARIVDLQTHIDNFEGEEHMKLTEEQIWKCNNDDNGVVHICLDHQNVVDFARSIEREIGFSKAELWIKRINDAVLAEHEACVKVCEDHPSWTGRMCAETIKARGQA